MPELVLKIVLPQKLGGRFGYFLFFLLFPGRGKGATKSSRGKGGYFYLDTEEGGVPRRGGGVVHTSAGRCRGEGGGANFFFFGAEMSFHKNEWGLGLEVLAMWQGRDQEVSKYGFVYGSKR